MIGVIRKFKTASPAVKASMALLFANLILKGISLISGPIFTRIMSADQYGIVSTFQSWQSLLTVIVTLNLSQGVFNNGMLEFKENRNQFQFALVVITAVCTGLFFLIFEIFKTPLLNMFEIPPVMVYVMVLYFLFVVSVYSCFCRFMVGHIFYPVLKFKLNTNKILTHLYSIIRDSQQIFSKIVKFSFYFSN